ncbi:MAG TPA: FliH/SctL family protein [Terriglobales bacterium]|nr:FliH/SctL family protein [Terriglobales bacterium]
MKSTWSEPETAVREFEYPVANNGTTTVSHGQSEGEIADERIVRRETHARQLGRQEGEAAARADYEQALKQERLLLLTAVNGFHKAREQYLRSVEAEVVHLALAIARKILHREARLDPLFLRAAVRVALDKLHDETQISLRVTPALAEEWRRFLSENRELAERVEVLGDESLTEMSCVVEASVGTAEIGVEAQLKEIEQAFLDLAAKRPETE